MIWWKKNPNVSTLTLGAVKYLISALVGILLKLALFLKIALKICLFLSWVQSGKRHCHLSLALNYFTVYQSNLSLKAELPGTNERKDPISE